MKPVLDPTTHLNGATPETLARVLLRRRRSSGSRAVGPLPSVLCISRYLSRSAR